MPGSGENSLALSAYLAVSKRAAPLARRLLFRRLADGKEDAARINERMGQAGISAPGGPLIWFHAASVGESVSLLELLRRLRERHSEITCLVTSGTLTSAQLLSERLPDGCIHQFVPLDVQPWVESFLDHWKPDLAVWTESELWPAMLCAVKKRGIGMLLINARISDTTFQRWKRMPGMARVLLSRFDQILAQDDLAQEQLVRLGAPDKLISVSGSLKEGATALPDSETERRRISKEFAGRVLWLAASTHPGEEEIVLRSHQAALRTYPRLALILAPRHPDRGDAVCAMARKLGFAVSQRSKDDAVDEDINVYVADTLGELGIWYRVAPVSFVGGSLAEIGGHNPYEPALLGSAVIHGPHVRNFRDAYDKLSGADAAVEVKSEAELRAALTETLAPDRAAAMAAAGWEVCSQGAEVTETVLKSVLTTLGTAD